ncbi:hypothetical protein L596_013316 [Steinernema carpocapsae]|uniref:Uncharacterized protein n=1 Tax=Steinernema carpocapsae TaxID=34508 RepID=A0A4U5NZU0_STECR|nr:hypothetical protein L596_013316 [Steinernema carpocapsae]
MERRCANDVAEREAEKKEAAKSSRGADKSRRGTRNTKHEKPKKFPDRPPCRSDNFAYLDEVLSTETSGTGVSEKQNSERVPDPKPSDSPTESVYYNMGQSNNGHPTRKKYVSLLDDEDIKDDLSAEVHSRYSQDSISESPECSCTCKCRDCRKMREKKKPKKRPGVVVADKDNEDVLSEILTTIDKVHLRRVPSVDPVDGEGIKMTSSQKILEMYYSSNIFHLEDSLMSMKTGDFRLCPVDGDVELSKLKRHHHNHKFMIYYKTFQGRFRRYKITQAFVGEEAYYFLECVDTEAPLFSSPYKLLKYYVDNRTYYSLQVLGFIRFPTGQVMKKGRFERHYDMIRFENKK